MNVLVFGATGGLGQHVWRAAVDAGHQVTVFVRSPHKLDHDDPRYADLRVVQGDVMDANAVAEAAQGMDIAVNCTSPVGGNGALEMVQSLVPAAALAGVGAFYLIGGMGALWAPGTNRQVLVQDWDDPDAMKRHGLSPALPKEMIRRMTRGHLASMAYLQSTGHPHTYICPGAMVEGDPSPNRLVTLDELGGRSPTRVPFADIAAVVAEDLGRGELLGHRVGVSREDPSVPVG